MTTQDIEVSLMFNLDYTQNYIVYNVTNINCLVRFEADILMVTKSGYASVFEIKITKADLKNDLNKKHIKDIGEIVKTFGGCYDAFDYYYEKIKHFSYAVPDHLLQATINQVPEFCGIYYFIERENGIPKMKLYRRPKIIKNYKWSDKEIFDLLRLGTMRIYNLKRKLIKK